VGNTSIHALPWPPGTDPITQGDDAIKALADAVDPKLTPYSQGTLASRPISTAGSPGKAGRLYYATDVKTLFVDTGTSWVASAPRRS
jgi:hypothetical protein